jgi:hypothetical protein
LTLVTFLLDDGTYIQAALGEEKEKQKMMKTEHCSR